MTTTRIDPEYLRLRVELAEAKQRINELRQLQEADRIQIARLQQANAETAQALEHACQALTHEQMKAGGLEVKLVMLKDDIAQLRADLVVALQAIVQRDAEVARLTEQGAHLQEALINAQAGLEQQGHWLRERAVPCAHTPPGSDPACVWCLVRMALERRLTWEARHDVLQAFDAAVQAVREEQG